MTTYVALLRGIAPMNPNMRGEKLKELFEYLKLKNVHTVIASGNVVFQSPSKNAAELESKIEKALPKQLGFKSTTIIRSKEELEKLIKKNPFKSAKHGPNNYLIITFFKKKAAGAREIATVVNLTKNKTPDFMRTVEKKFGKEITTRTWNTVGRIMKKMESLP